MGLPSTLRRTVLICETFLIAFGCHSESKRKLRRVRHHV
jgi:hypothetical protein